jgi:hypothetical protein
VSVRIERLEWADNRVRDAIDTFLRDGFTVRQIEKRIADILAEFAEDDE